MNEFIEGALPGVGGLLGREKLRQKRRAVVMQHLMDNDGSRRRDVEEGVDPSDPSSAGYRVAQQGERPTKRAQWDDADSCWVEWSKATGDWVIVGTPPYDE